MNTWTSAVAIAIGSLLITTVASAEEKDQVQDAGASPDLGPATHALELTVGTGYEQGFGNVAQSQPSLTEVGQAGGAVQIGVGYRLLPQLTLGGYGSGAMFSRGDLSDPSSKLYSAAAGVEADWHFLSSGSLLDPWISLASGWRGYFSSSNAGTTSAQGLEIAKLQIGVDYRIDKAVAISPVLGADISTFFTQSTLASSAFQNISTPQASTFLFAGFQGRFDIPTRGDASKSVASR